MFLIKLDFCGRLLSQQDWEPRVAREMLVVVAAAATGKPEGSPEKQGGD